MRNDFPFFKNGLCYLDSAATTHKPSCVINAMSSFYENEYATVHRAVYSAASLATERYENVRDKARSFINASRREEVIFTRGTTDGINLLANCLDIEKEDEIIVSYLEHHSNLVPWQRKGKVKAIRLTQELEIDLNHFEELIASPRAKILSIAHISNLTGGAHPIKMMIKKAKEKGLTVVIDGAQAAAHVKINVADLGCDFYVFSSHKMYGPTGVGILYGRYELLEKMPPYQGGGDMIVDVTITSSTYQDPPLKFEAGTPSIVEVIGLGAAIDYLTSHKEESLIEEFKGVLLQQGASIIGNPKERISILSFMIQDVHPLDLATLLSHHGVAIRSGHMCVQPAISWLGVSSVCRLSTGIYTEKKDVELFEKALHHAILEIKS
jgi:cysteine desulfurase/selenocysteine lyase